MPDSLYNIREMLRLGLTDGTIRVHDDTPSPYAGQIGTVIGINAFAPLFQVRFGAGPCDTDLFLEDEVEVLECHPVVSFVLSLLDPRFWLAVS